MICFLDVATCPPSFLALSSVHIYTGCPSTGSSCPPPSRAYRSIINAPRTAPVSVTDQIFPRCVGRQLLRTLFKFLNLSHYLFPSVELVQESIFLTIWKLMLRLSAAWVFIQGDLSVLLYTTWAEFCVILFLLIYFFLVSPILELIFSRPKLVTRCINTTLSYFSYPTH
ncbi:hypothetical protein GYMLUDRAFT_96275 [Collybiopsis luxurians FD-317 M1]|uniref:Uncharacterized protein n=1 Tax=Collybiopsis luxurians FD-317 M1 TaxID=944289 RepID=A0A0D0CGR6_9AGAR|nr:hypothetical protein GYMLUDRAFT_96275 [Collybiopsis luxurians FD-317 M1]